MYTFQEEYKQKETVRAEIEKLAIMQAETTREEINKLKEENKKIKEAERENDKLRRENRDMEIREKNYQALLKKLEKDGIIQFYQDGDYQYDEHGG